MKLGIALGSGAARGLAHAGVLEVLEREGIQIDMVAGTSMGALIGALYAQGKSISFIRQVVTNMNWTRLLPLLDLTVPKSGLISGNRMQSWLKMVIGRDAIFDDLKKPFACVATDIICGREVVIDEGSVLEAVRASISIPGLFTVVRKNGRYLVDGGLVNAVPVSVLQRMGADFIIAVNVLPEVKDSDLPPYVRKAPNLIEVLLQSLYIGEHGIARKSMEGADVIIEPHVAHIGPGDFNSARESILQGQLAAVDAMLPLRKALADYREMDSYRRKASPRVTAQP